MNEEFLDIIKTRRSVRSYRNESVERDTIEQIIQVGSYAPSAKNIQPWRFIVITDPNVIGELSSAVKKQIMKMLKWRFISRIIHPELRNLETVRFLYGVSLVKEDSIFFKAPVVVFVVTEDKRFYDESCACCAENMMLAAHALGLGSCWIGLAHFIDLNKRLIERIGVPAHHHISSALIFGHPKEQIARPSIRKPCSGIIRWMD
ncbi:MAG: nitroreductase family protein [Candidatus Thermoplasmatota archaeon]|nr:nitroreductase family protein [Candidatus Thermoplasmatota archaeon]